MYRYWSFSLTPALPRWEKGSHRRMQIVEIGRLFEGVACLHQ